MMTRRAAACTRRAEIVTRARINSRGPARAASPKATVQSTLLCSFLSSAAMRANVRGRLECC